YDGPRGDEDFGDLAVPHRRDRAQPRLEKRRKPLVLHVFKPERSSRSSRQRQEHHQENAIACYRRWLLRDLFGLVLHGCCRLHGFPGPFFREWAGIAAGAAVSAKTHALRAVAESVLRLYLDRKAQSGD